MRSHGDKPSFKQFLRVITKRALRPQLQLGTTLRVLGSLGTVKSVAFTSLRLD